MIFSSEKGKRRLKIPSEENKYKARRSTLLVKTLSFNEKKTSKDLGGREQAHKCALDPKDQTFKSKPSL